MDLPVVEQNSNSSQTSMELSSFIENAVILASYYFSNHTRPQKRKEYAIKKRALILDSFKLLASIPICSEAVFEIYSNFFDGTVKQNFELREKDEGIEANRIVDNELIQVIFQKLSELVSDGPSGLIWASFISKWSVELLGDLSSKYSSKIGHTYPNTTETLPFWRSIPAISALLDITILSMKRLMNDTVDGAHDCVSLLLDKTVYHSPYFDWIMALIGDQFPSTIINRVLTLGLVEFGQTKAVSGRNNAVSTELPKIKSVLSILQHLFTSHEKEIEENLIRFLDRVFVSTSLNAAIIPYLLHLASLSTKIKSILMVPALNHMSSGVSCKMLATAWSEYEQQILPLIVDIILKCNSTQSINLLLKHGIKETAMNCCATIVEYMFERLHCQLHYVISPSSIEVLDALYEELDIFMTKWLMDEERWRAETVSMLLHFVCLQRGQVAAVRVFKRYLFEVPNRECFHFTLLMAFVRETEVWEQEFVEVTIRQCFNSVISTSASNFLDNLIAMLEVQRESPASREVPPPLSKIIQSFSAESFQDSLLSLVVSKSSVLLRKLLTLIKLVSMEFPLLDISHAQRVSRAYISAIFDLLAEIDEDGSNEHILTLCFECVDLVLVQFVQHPTGLIMVLKFFLRNIFLKPDLLGGRRDFVLPSSDAVPDSTCLMRENIKFSSMPTHPLGTSTMFHAGIIGEGKRKNRSTDLNAASDIKKFAITSIIIRLCGEAYNTQEALKQLSLLLVEVVSPDIMYNGLPWPELEFTKFTIERDLQITQTLDKHPVLWSILMALAESRPALCYCSVILRAVVATMISHWVAASTGARKAIDYPKQLETTRRILQLLSVGQFIPHPLTCIADALHAMSAFHVNCVLTDVWHFLKDNVPSPAAFRTTNSHSVASTRDFGVYKNYRQYCDRFRMILIQYIGQCPLIFKRAFVDVATLGMKSLQIAMDY